MKITLNQNKSSGYALILVMTMVCVAVVVLAATMQRTTSVTKMNERNNQYVGCVNAAEAATEKVIAQMRSDYLTGGDSAVAANLDRYRQGIPLSREDVYWSDYQFSNAAGVADQTFVQIISNKVYTPLQSQYSGLSGWRTTYRVLSNAHFKPAASDVVGAVQQDVELDSIPIFQFAIYYNGLLEFTWAAPFTVRGRTHSNNNIYTGSTAALTFKDLVTASGVIVKRSWAGFDVRQMTGAINYQGDPGYITNMPVLSLPIGTNNAADAVREIVNLPPPGESPSSSMGQERYYNKAGMVLLVGNTNVTALIKYSPDDLSPAVITSALSTSALATNFPFLNLTHTFTDQRENKTILASEINIARFGTWAATNKYTSPSSPDTKHPQGNPVNILYVRDDRSVTAVQLAAVRLVSGSSLPANPGDSGLPTGFTLATPNPLYVLGDYNCPNSADRNTTNTTHTVPASLISDSLTLLSSAWQDSKSSGSFNNRDAVNTTVNAAIVTGIVYSSPSDGTPFSGGVMNLPRLLEDWGNGSVKLTMNTSMVNLYNSVRATAPFQNPGYYYYAPTRDFNFDPNFKDPTKLPPGTPMLGVILRAKWVNPPPDTTSYAGL